MNTSIFKTITAGVLVIGFSASVSLAGKPPKDPPTPSFTYGNTAVVATSGGDYTHPVAAVADLAAWCGTPSADSPCLVKVMPGVYDIGSAYVLLPQYVDLEGSGAEVTRIKGLDTVEYQNEGGKFWNNGVVRLNGGNLRDITVEADYTDQTYFPFAVEVRESAKIANVTAIAHDNGNGIYIWVDNNVQLVGSDVDIDNTTVIQPDIYDYAIGIEVNWTTSLRINDSKVLLSDCLNPDGCYLVAGITTWIDAPARISDTFVKSPDEGFDAAGAPALIDVRIDAPTPVADAEIKCISVYDVNFDPIVCP